ncbi:hypothetical protein [Catellatospora chokoriensis]|uniref:Uncharacterized protein n=1 Tax=Catellatospora chokoriensis TaxID=310353 RepID=A0A8J3JVQ6_9ACTN|nr:hypothetical protein [Catellatospora chokoriensis]GIF87946.1 hypothetical protein Cch02nite_13900 [Catellatospora chokoriensis]
MSERRDTRRLIVRLGLAGAAVVHLWWGLWAYAAPHHFFGTFPGFGQRWTAGYPPYNEHLVVDLGATFLTLGVLLAVPAVRYRRAVARLALAGATVFGTLHLAFHAGHRGVLSGPDWIAGLVPLVVGVLLPVVLWVAAPPD